MERVTDKMITRRIELMQGDGMNVALDGAYGQFAVTTKDESRKLSPRAPNRQILDWLDAFAEGWRQHERMDRARGVPSD